MVGDDAQSYSVSQVRRWQRSDSARD